MAVNCLKEKAGAESVGQSILDAGGQAAVFPCDVRNSCAVREMVGQIVSRWGCLDILINNAGLSRDRTLLKMVDSEWTDVIETNLNGTFYCLREAALVMARRKRGVIINVASYRAFRPSDNIADRLPERQDGWCWSSGE